MKIARRGIQGLGALMVAGAVAYLLTAHSAPRAVHAPAPRTAARRGPWSDAPSSQSSGWVREQWIMTNQPAWIQREWRAASCPPLRVNTEFYYFSGPENVGNVTLALPPASVYPLWWDAPIPPTGFPYAGQRGC